MLAVLQYFTKRDTPTGRWLTYLFAMISLILFAGGLAVWLSAPTKYEVTEARVGKWVEDMTTQIEGPPPHKAYRFAYSWVMPVPMFEGQRVPDNLKVVVHAAMLSQEDLIDVWIIEAFLEHVKFLRTLPAKDVAEHFKRLNALALPWVGLSQDWEFSRAPGFVTIRTHLDANDLSLVDFVEASDKVYRAYKQLRDFLVDERQRLQRNEAEDTIR